jgi:hypothetical protein
MRVVDLTPEAALELARRIVATGTLSRTPFELGAGETWSAELDGAFVIVDSLTFEVRLSEVRDIRTTGLEGRAFSMELPRAWRLLQGAEAQDVRACLLLRHAAAGTFTAPRCGWDLERFRSELLEPVVLEVT